jgi:hypothetical protein
MAFRTYILLLLAPRMWALPYPSHDDSRDSLISRVLSPIKESVHHSLVSIFYSHCISVLLTPGSTLRHRSCNIQASDLPLPTVAATWYAGWHANDFPPENLSWEKYNRVTYAFAETNPDPAIVTVSPEDDPILRRVVRLGHESVR